MKFDKDIFISYAHLDNKPLPPREIGWISGFHDTLQDFVSRRLGEDVRIWRDSRLQGNDIFSDEIIEQFRKTAIFVSILTPRYIRSEWCSKEIRGFCEAAEKSGGVVVDNKSRIFKVIKTPIETQESLPDVARNQIGYTFFKYDDDETPLEFDEALGQKFAEAYNQKVAKLADHIKKLLVKLRKADGTGQLAEDLPGEEKPTVFLAECSYDLEEERDRIGTELEFSGYRVLPNHPLPKTELKQVAEVERLLGECELSVHLVGKSYGSVPDGPSRTSNVVLQNRLGAAASKDRGLSRIIWLPENVQSDDPVQQEFIDALQRDADLQSGADLITAGFEHLKQEIHNRLKRLQEPDTSGVEVLDAGSETGQFIYLICAREDREDTLPLRIALKAKGYSVEIPAFEGEAAELRKVNESLLSVCDAVIVFYGSGGEAWKRSIDSDLKKLPSYRSGKPLQAGFTYLSTPVTSDKKELVLLGSSNLFDGSEGGSDELVSAFVDMVSSNLGQA